MQRHWLIGSILLALSAGVEAVNLGFLKNTPVARFNDQDMDMAHAALNQALAGPDGVTVSWENPATGAQGSYTPLDSFQRNGRTCRTAQLAHSARGRQGTGRYTLCQQENGSWGFAP
ncbi:MAG: RT0821/Lpp0805 family surface protein [Candidatus Competibacterales bacterium]